MTEAGELPDLVRSLALAYAIEWSEEVSDSLFAPEGYGTRFTLEAALARTGPLPAGILPLAVVDEQSIAVVVLDDAEGRELDAGHVHRLFLSDVDAQHQLGLLDIDPLLYLRSLEEELAARSAGLQRVLDEVGPAYRTGFLAHGKRPRPFVVRPVRIACQNVIVALGAIAQDSGFDGLSVVAWQTCEVPHVATHEANRALAALTLCDAFQNGGTMEIRFDQPVRTTVDGKAVTYDCHPERAVPASLRRYGRTVGVVLGAEDPAAITPTEARELFLAVTPMPPDLRARVDQAIGGAGVAPERICFTLLSRIWREVELDLILATSARSASILEGGAPWEHRGARQAELEVCRAAVMVGMLHRRLDGTDSAGADGEVRVVEDRTAGITWSIDERSGSIAFAGLAPDADLPWTVGRRASSLRVIAASHVDDSVRAALALRPDAAVLLPRDASDVGLPPDVVVLRCPDRLADVDKAVERSLMSSRISRG